MHAPSKVYTAEGILASLGYKDPLVAARQHARMILLGRLAHYQAEARQMEAKWGSTLAEARARYQIEGQESAEADDDYLQWQWHVDATETIREQIAALAEP